MRPVLHYDLQGTQFATADKSTARLLFAVDDTLHWTVQNMDIINSYVHEPAMHTRPIYVRERDENDGQYLHGRTTGRLIKN